ncbi:hypothetical protein ABG067_005534 [Albugo candida]
MNIRERLPPTQYFRQWIDLDDGGQVSLDWAVPGLKDPKSSWKDVVDFTKPIMFVLPGLSSGSHDQYVLKLVNSMLQLNWQCVVYNARGCGRTPLKTAELFCMAKTDDIREAVKKIESFFDLKNSSQKFVACGFSMGSNLLVKYLGEEQEKTSFHGAISIGNPYDLVKCTRHFKSTWWYRHTYDRVLTSNLKRLLFHRNDGLQILASNPRIDLIALQKATTLMEFDEQLTVIVYNYANVGAYHEDGSCVRVMDKVKIPLLCVSAKDDPICIAEAIPYDMVERNPNVILATTNLGGHLAFLESPRDSWRHPRKARTCWSVRVASEFAESIRNRC